MKLPLLILLATIPALFAVPLSREIVLNTAREIDEILLDELQNNKLAPTPFTADHVFLRRAYINIAGRLPNASEARQFLDSSEAHKRTDLIESLIGSTGQKAQLFNYWGDLFRLKSKKEAHGLGWHVWLQNAVADNMPYDQMVNDMLSATGHVAEDPASGYYLRDRGMLLDNVSNTAQIFLGQQIGCAQCHDHPFDDTTQLEYYQIASFLGGTEYRFQGGTDKIRGMVAKNLPKPTLPIRKKKNRPNRRAGLLKKEVKKYAGVFRYHQRNATTDNPNRQLKLPVDYKYDDAKPHDVVMPEALFGEDIPGVTTKNRKQIFADWVTSPENPYFTKVIANRMWEYVFGYGLIANPDDLGGSPAPFHPKLVTHLEKVMAMTNYDIEEFLRILYHTQLFQREVTTTSPSAGFSFAFQGPTLRRMSAQELRDSLLNIRLGDIDKNKNESFAQTWQNYTEGYRTLMAASPEQVEKVKIMSEDAFAKTLKFQKKSSELRVKIKMAREKGQKGKTVKLMDEAKKLREQNAKSYVSEINNDEFLKKTIPFVVRRNPNVKSTYKDQQLRSSELASPQYGGSFIAEFGGSDRESPSAAHTNASVPQILRLLNSHEIHSISNNKNTFAQELKTLKTAEERLDHIFLTFYSAYPTDLEKTNFLTAVTSPRDTIIFVKSVVTSNRFLFVQ